MIVRDNKGFLFDFVVKMEVSIIKAEEGEVYVVVNKRFKFFFCAVCKENVRNTRFFYGDTFAVNKLDAF